MNRKMPITRAISTSGITTPIAAFAPLDSPPLVDEIGVLLLDPVLVAVTEDVFDDSVVDAELSNAKICTSVFCHRTGTASHNADVLACIENSPSWFGDREAGMLM